LERVAIGKILRARGVKGELLVAPLCEDLKRYSQVEKVFISDLDAKEKPYRIKRSRIFQGKVLLQLEGIDTRTKAEELKGRYLEIDKKDVPLLTEGCYYAFDLVNCQVLSLNGKKIGEVKEVLFFPAHPVLSVKKGKKEYLIPFVKEVVKKVDREKKIIWIEPIKGLLD
jgi:16S rRNA processing protein RimM